MCSEGSYHIASLHLLLCPTHDSARVLADVMFAWSQLDDEGVTAAGRYAARGMLRCVLALVQQVNAEKVCVSTAAWNHSPSCPLERSSRTFSRSSSPLIQISSSPVSPTHQPNLLLPKLLPNSPAQEVRQSRWTSSSSQNWVRSISCN